MKRIRFGQHEFDPATGKLLSSGQAVKLQPQPARVLQMLLASPGNLVGREELREALWPDGTNVEFDQGLNYSIRQIRLALGESASDPQFIETIPKKGYRFIMPVEPTPTAQPEPKIQRRWNWPIPLAVIGVLLVAVGWMRYGQSSDGMPQSILVRSFVPLGLSQDESWYGDAITQQLIENLARVKSFRVLPWSTSLSLKGQRLSSSEAGKKLGVEAVLEGSIRRREGRIEVSAQLVDTKSERVLWSYRDEREGNDLGKIESAMVSSLADSLRFRIVEGDRPGAQRRPADADTYNLYLKGVSMGEQFSPEGTLASIQAFEEVIRREPGFAPAYVGLANSLVIEPFTRKNPPLVNLEKARQMAKRALELDPNYAEAHAVMAHALFNLWRWNESETEFQAALRLDPDSSMTLQLYAIFLGTQGRFDEAIRQVRRAGQLAPTSGLIAFSECIILFHAKRYDEAVAECNKSLAIDPGRFIAHNLLGRAYTMKGMHAEALDQLERWVRGHKTPTQELWHVYHLAAAGRVNEAKEMLRSWEEKHPNAPNPPVPYGLAKLVLGDTRAGLAGIEKSVQAHVPAGVWFKTTPELERYRGDDRLRRILAQLDAN